MQECARGRPPHRPTPMSKQEQRTPLAPAAKGPSSPTEEPTKAGRAQHSKRLPRYRSKAASREHFEARVKGRNAQERPTKPAHGSTQVCLDMGPLRTREAVWPEAAAPSFCLRARQKKKNYSCRPCFVVTKEMPKISKLERRNSTSGISISSIKRATRFNLNEKVTPEVTLSAQFFSCSQQFRKGHK